MTSNVFYDVIHRRYEADAPTLEVGEEADTLRHKPRYGSKLRSC